MRRNAVQTMRSGRCHLRTLGAGRHSGWAYECSYGWVNISEEPQNDGLSFGFPFHQPQKRSLKRQTRIIPAGAWACDCTWTNNGEYCGGFLSIRRDRPTGYLQMVHSKVRNNKQCQLCLFHTCSYISCSKRLSALRHHGMVWCASYRMMRCSRFSTLDVNSMHPSAILSIINERHGLCAIGPTPACSKEDSQLSSLLTADVFCFTVLYPMGAAALVF